MADLWTHEFCLGCDRQTDGTAYCSESCRLADFEKTALLGSTASSPGLRDSDISWNNTRGCHSESSHINPAVQFCNPHPFSPASHHLPKDTATTRTIPSSSSNSSLCSMNTISSNTGASPLSEKTRQELQSYAASFDNARLARRRSY